MKFLKDFFSTNNEINENTVVGAILLIAVLLSTFIPIVDGDKYYILSGMTMLCFGIGAFKR